MEILQYLSDGFSVALSFDNLLIILIGCFLGTVIGMLPGIGPINAIAILFPVSFSMGLSPESAIILFAGIFYGSQYGNSISSILLNVPGTSSAAVTAIDGHKMAMDGRAGPALAMSAIASFIGGTLSIFWLILFANMLADFAIEFGPAEYFVLMLFAFTSLSSLAGDYPIKAFISVLFGIILSTVGIDGQTGSERFTFGSIQLLDGFNFIVITIGFFAISEAILVLTDEFSKRRNSQSEKVREDFPNLMITKQEFKRSIWGILRSNVSGFLVGVLPGAGATIASFIAYNHEKKIFSDKGDFGKGDIHGVAAPESANNSSAVGSFIPLLILGVPGSETTAVILAALISFGVSPGPALLSTSPNLFWGLVASMFIGNIVLIILNLPLTRIFVKILTIPKPIIMTLVLLLSVTGVFAVSNNYFDILIMMSMGVIGYFMKRAYYPLAPVILGLVLGGLMEVNLRRALTYSDGSLNILFEGSITKFLWVLVLLSILLPLFIKHLHARSKAKQSRKEK